MSMKKTDLVKNLARKIEGHAKVSAIPGRFGHAAGDVVDRKEQRRRDAAAGLVPFACKLPSELVKKINDRALTHEGGVNALLAELIGKGLG